LFACGIVRALRVSFEVYRLGVGRSRLRAFVLGTGLGGEGVVGCMIRVPVRLDKVAVGSGFSVGTR